MTDTGAIYEDPSAPVSDRVDDLLGRMTVEEKIGQLIGMWVGKFSVTSESRQIEGLQEQTISDVKDGIREYNLGFATPFGAGISPYNNPAVTSRVANQLQRVATNETRLGIPILIPVDAVHGHAYIDGSTVFPHNLGMAATWDPQLVRKAARVTAREMRATGATQNYSPTADVARDPRWGRTYETYGESPHLVRKLMTAEIEGLQEPDFTDSEVVAATVKHFPAYSSPARGEDTAPVDVSPTTLYRVHVPPFEDAVDAGVLGVMPSYNSIDGEPVHGSRRFLTELLRDDLGFDGIVCSDWLAVEMLAREHRTAATLPDAVEQALNAGLDVFSVGGPKMARRVKSLLDAGRISETRLDESVRRILASKFRLGLFEDPFVNPGQASATVGKLVHRQTALECVRESATLLKNSDRTLPLDPELNSVFVTGPNADSINNLCGGWSVIENDDYQGTTIVDGVSRTVDDDTRVRYEKGSSMTEVGDLDRVREGAANADAAVVVLGENWYVHEFGPQTITGRTGAFPKRDQLALPEAQRRLLETVSETGTPTVLVLISGRPLVLTDVEEHADAILMGYLPGKEGGQGIAEVLFGSVNPSGKLPISMPKSIGQLPQTHDPLPNPAPIGNDEHQPSYDPLFEFGHGLSYADCSYEAIEVDDPVVEARGTVDVTVALENAGDRSVEEIVQLYVRDLVSSRVTPIRELKAFTRVTVPSGERTRATLSLDVDDLGVVHPDGSTDVEPGTFEVTAGGLSAEFEVE